MMQNIVHRKEIDSARSAGRKEGASNVKESIANKSS